ncbi:MAG: glycosyltransferase family 4 protein, partial [Bacteroides sp.]|nr:glycosyltransferase family 4 protein [Bacteroides sp.]
MDKPRVLFILPLPMQHSLPVVSTDEGAIPDMVIDGETGFICQRRNVDSLVNAIEKLLTN